MITTILIAEDDGLMARLYRKVFNLEGYQVEMVENGQEALDKAREVKPTLILLDVMMPQLNGLDALDKFKADPELKNIPIIMLTNLAGQQDMENALAKGAIKYLVKSEYGPKQVADIVKQVLGGTGAAPAAAPAPAPGSTTPPTASPAAPPAAPSANPAPAAAPAPQAPATPEPPAGSSTPPPTTP